MQKYSLRSDVKLLVLKKRGKIIICIKLKQVLTGCQILTGCASLI